MRIDQKKGKRSRDLNYYLSLSYPFSVEEINEDGVKNYVLSIPDLPGCWSEGASLEEARQKLVESKEVWILANLAEGNPIPEPEKEEEFSGKFLLRISPRLHMKLSRSARQKNLSLNQHIRAVLEAASEGETHPQMDYDLVSEFKAFLENKFQIFDKRLESLESGFNCVTDWLSSYYYPPIGTGTISLAETDVSSAASWLQIASWTPKIGKTKVTLGEPSFIKPGQEAA